MLETLVVAKSWGREIIVVNAKAAGYCGKIMEARPGRTSRIERHRTKDETFYMLAGAVKLELFGNGPEPLPPSLEKPTRDHGTAILHAGIDEICSYRILPGVWHRFGALDPGTRFCEFSTYHFEEDTERWEPPTAC